ncbi:MAG: hypothetical protein RBR29_08445 [Castellaniella sp.]|uniref:hypothetical protein n=1 Tax=Castellaniella sp. TaxID=1955812 RepID=UPI002A35F0B1|nr:hypothetical protein [Castellaniella sp.]MDY0309803.1 hypothetical protein [Castellaniella sp.]
MSMPMQQAGQALAESLAVLLVLGSLWLGVAWLGRLQDSALQLAHASRRAAFAHAHQGLPLQALVPGGDGYLDAPGHRWHTRQGQSLLEGESGLDVHPLMAAATGSIGDSVAEAADLRREFRLGDRNVWRAEAQAKTAGLSSVSGALFDFDRLGLDLRRHTAILVGDGAAAGDGDAQSILAGSPHAWGTAAQTSRNAGQAVLGRLRAVDSAWGRALPDWDWLSSWTGSVPRPHLRIWSQP